MSMTDDSIKQQKRLPLQKEAPFFPIPYDTEETCLSNLSTVSRLMR